ncbi:MAG: hypothetical protein NUV57_00820, partial [archaeon]|nr:hypothetical protein [archaeon]
MQFNLLNLHDSVDDDNARKLLRVYSILPRFSKIKDGSKAEQAMRVVKFLRKVNEKLKRDVSPAWKEEWLKAINYNFAKSTYRDWFIGRASVPLIALKRLEIFGLRKEITELLNNINYISSTTGEIVKIPKQFNPDLIYLTGLIIGDGSLGINNRHKENNLLYRIGIHSGDRKFLYLIKPMFETIFEIKHFIVSKYKNNGAWDLTKNNKAIYRFFTKIIGIQNGKKSHKALIPGTIKNLVPENQVAFLAGMVDSDIGKHSNGMGSTFSSKQIVIDLVEVLDKLEVKA